MIPKHITSVLNQRQHVVRPAGEHQTVQECLEFLGLRDHKELREFFMEYKTTNIFRRGFPEIIDIIQLRDFADPVRELWEIPETFICLSSSEGEDLVLYSLEDQSVYDLGVRDVIDLGTDKVRPRWASFYEFIEWYLSDPPQPG